MHPHQHATLAAELRRPGYAGLTADAAFAALGEPATRQRLAATRYDPKNLPGGYAAGFPAGLPGYPNRTRREAFDAAWKEARGG